MAAKVWDELVAWLTESHGVKKEDVKVRLTESKGGRGLVASRDLHAGEPALAVPASALLHVRSLPPALPAADPRLTAAQRLSLFLALNHPLRGPRDRPGGRGFGPFLRSLPEGFGTAPLSWELHRQLARSSADGAGPLGAEVEAEAEAEAEAAGPGGWRRTALAALSPTARAKHEAVRQRFSADWRACCEAARGSAAFTLGEYLWGWMNVNSRCIWYDLGLPRHDDNITLAPGIDMANHLPNRQVRTIQTPGHLTLYASQPPAIFSSPGSKTLIARGAPPSPTGAAGPHEIVIQEGEEVCFTYGPHDNATLLAEYGFVVEDNPFDSVDVTQMVMDRFAELDEHERREKSQTLEACGYWGDYTVQANPKPAAPSHRLLVALRLLHLAPATAPPPPKRQKTDLARLGPPDEYGLWIAHVRGESDDLGPMNEKQVHATVVQLCTEVGDQLEARLANIEEAGVALEDADADARYSLKCVEAILSAEAEVLAQCKLLY